MIDKISLINDLKMLHKEIAQIYSEIFSYKLERDSKFEEIINNEYFKEGIKKSEDKIKWNEKYIHRSAYTLLNKILFIRICEDKGFMLNEEDSVMGETVNDRAGQKLTKKGLERWTQLVKNYSLTELFKFAFKDMQKSYQKINLYKEDMYDWLIPLEDDVSLKFNNEELYNASPYVNFENILVKLIETLDTSRYDFNISSDNVLGDVYEKFMDRDTRRELGQFYTPNHVIEYILENSLEMVNVVENPFVKVFDPSCGSGHFLIMSYDLLKQKFLESLDELKKKFHEIEYEIEEDSSIRRVKGEEYWTEKYLHYHILKNCIYGADIDGFALQLTTINLLLKDLDHVFINDLNIIECDSLIKWESDYNWQDLLKQLKKGSLFLNVEFKDTNGNIQTQSLSFDQTYEIIKRGKIWNEEFDFIVGNPPWISLSGKHEQTINYHLLQYYTNAHGGNTYMPNLYEFFIRRMLKKLNSNGIFSFVIPDRFAENGQFKDLRENILNNFKINNLVFEVKFPDVIADAMIFVIANKKVKENQIEIGNFEDSYLVNQSDFNDGENFAFKYYKNKTFQTLINKIKNNSIMLGTICDTTSGFGGKSTEITTEKIDDNQILVLKGECIERYAVRKFFYFNFIRENITGRTTDRNKLGADKKILIRKTGDKIIACYDNSGIFPEQSLYFIYNLSSTFDYMYILGLLNSRIINFYYSNNLLTNKNSTAQVKKVDLDNIPIYKCTNQKNVIKLVEELNEIKNQLINFNYCLNADFEKIINRGIEYERLVSKYYLTQYKLDNQIFSLYSLQEDEIDFINKDFSIEISKYEAFKELVNLDEFFKELKQMNQIQISKKYKTEINFVDILRNEIMNDYKITNENMHKFYNLDKLYEEIKKYIAYEIKIFLSSTKKYLTLNEIIKHCEEKIGNFMVLSNVLKFENPTFSNENIIKEILKSFSSTFPNFLKKKNSTWFVKYDKDIIGLWEWEDYIHKNYFVDFINYQTSNQNANDTKFLKIMRDKKKATAALDVLKQLDFEDKNDYLELLSDNILRSFK